MWRVKAFLHGARPATVAGRRMWIWPPGHGHSFGPGCNGCGQQVCNGSTDRCKQRT